MRVFTFLLEGVHAKVFEHRNIIKYTPTVEPREDITEVDFRQKDFHQRKRLCYTLEKEIQHVVGKEGEDDPYKVSQTETGWYLVHDLMLVHAPTSDQRAGNQKFWQEKQRNMNVLTILSFIGLFGNVVLLTTASTALVIGAELVAFCVLVCFSVLCIKRSLEAEKQRISWGIDDVSRRVIRSRGLAYNAIGIRRGFYEVYQQQYGKNLHSLELRLLYEEGFKAQKKKFDEAITEQEKEAVLEQFFSEECILNPVMMIYAFGKELPEAFENHREEYLQFKQGGIPGYFDRKKAEVETIYQQQKTTEEARCFRPYKAAKEQHQKVIDDAQKGLIQLYDQFLTENPGDQTKQQRKKEQMDRWKKEIEHLNVVYNWRTKSIFLGYDSKLNAWKQLQISYINDLQKNDSIRIVFNEARNLFNRVYCGYFKESAIFTKEKFIKEAVPPFSKDDETWPIIELDPCYADTSAVFLNYVKILEGRG